MINLQKFLNSRNLKKYNKKVKQINNYYEQYKSFDEEKIKSFLSEIKNSDISNEEKVLKAMAIAKVASKNTLGMSYYNVQLLGALALVDGRIAQMKTGEGKTLMCSAAVAANYALGLKTHVATANEYLAQRDCMTLKPLYNALGLSANFNLQNMPPDLKKQAYNGDVSYSTAQEMGFDYLRDNLVSKIEEKVQWLNHQELVAIIDEADFILIDEARTPLIISGFEGEQNLKVYAIMNEIAKKLKPMSFVPQKVSAVAGVEKAPDGDFWVDLKERTLHLAEPGYETAHKLFVEHGLIKEENENSLYNNKNLWMFHDLLNALKAHHLYHKEKEYTIIENEIVIIDENTGRLSTGRTWSEGLHQAIEAKEGLNVNPVSSTLGTISIQNYFRHYGKLSGMTGTALHVAEELEQIYNMQVVEIPTNEKGIRKDHSDVVFFKADEKYKAIVAEISKRQANNQPILVGATSVEESEYISQLLTQNNIRHTLLNAKSHAYEAEIIANAGLPGNITVSTSMAGRGTDIILGGNLDHYKLQTKNQIDLLQKRKDAIKLYASVEILAKPMEIKFDPTNEFFNTYYSFVSEQFYLNQISVNKIFGSFKAETAFIDWFMQHLNTTIKNVEDSYSERRELAKKSGGLCVIGCSRHDSRRIDDQLRGRAGRQGEPGESIFFISFEDTWLKAFGENVLMKLLASKSEPGVAIVSPMITRTIEKSQRQIEGMHFEGRKQMFQYDSVLEESRKFFFSLRDEFLTNQFKTKEILLQSIEKNLSQILKEDSIDLESSNKELFDILDNIFEGKSKNKEDLEKVLSHYLYIEKHHSEKLLELLKLQDFSVENINNEQKLHELISIKLEKYFSYMTDDFWSWVNSHTLRSLDKSWIEYLNLTTEIRNSIHLRAYAQLNPIFEYKKACFDLMSSIIDDIEKSILKDMLDKIVIQSPDNVVTDLDINYTETIFQEANQNPIIEN